MSKYYKIQLDVEVPTGTPYEKVKEIAVETLNSQAEFTAVRIYNVEPAQYGLPLIPVVNPS